MDAFTQIHQLIEAALFDDANVAARFSFSKMAFTDPDRGDSARDFDPRQLPANKERPRLFLTASSSEYETIDSGTDALYFVFDLALTTVEVQLDLTMYPALEALTKALFALRRSLPKETLDDTFFSIAHVGIRTITLQLAESVNMPMEEYPQPKGWGSVYQIVIKITIG